MTSAPNGCWRLSIERTASGCPESRSRSVATTVVVPRSKAIAKRRAVVSPGSTSISSSSTTTAVTSKPDERRTPPSTRRTPTEAVGSRSSIASSNPAQIRALILERRLFEHHVAFLHRRTQDHVPADTGHGRLRPRLQRRHLHDQVLARHRPAGQPPAIGELSAGEGARIDRPDRQLSGDDPHLALLAGAVAAAGRVDRDSVPAGGVEHRRATGYPHLGALRQELQPDALGAVARLRELLLHGAQRAALNRRCGAAPLTLRRRAREAVASAAAARRARCAAIQLAPQASWPSSRSAARALRTQTSAVDMIAEVRPGGHRDRQEGGVERVAVGEPERDVRRAARTCSRRARRGSSASR